MNWRELLTYGINYNYQITEKLFDLTEDDKLDWKPATGSNWLNTGQLLLHITGSCGACFKGFVTGDWGMPEGTDVDNLSPEEMLPPAEKMPTVGSVAEAKKLLADDKQIAIDMLAKCGDEDLESKPAPAPWDPSEIFLGHRLLQMIEHLAAHKGQLFYYLKLQGKPVNTNDLWGM